MFYFILIVLTTVCLNIYSPYKCTVFLKVFFSILAISLVKSTYYGKVHYKVVKVKCFAKSPEKIMSENTNAGLNSRFDVYFLLGAETLDRSRTFQKKVQI